MTDYRLTQLALRAAVNTRKKDLSGREGSPADDIKDVAMRRAQEMVNGNSTLSSKASQSSAQTEAIALAVMVLQTAYFAVSHQLNVLKNETLAFDKERLAGVSIFRLPTDVVEKDLSTEEKGISSFLFLSQSFKKELYTYLGIQKGELSAEQNATFHSVLPFYRMSEALGQPYSSDKPLDIQRNAISLFFRSALPAAINDIDVSFQTSYKFVEFFRSLWQRKNYLNNKRAPRFIMMSLSNLLWNLQHPVDPATGFPLSSDVCISLCRDVELLLNKLLDPNTAPYIHQISNEKNQLLSFIRKVEVHTKALAAAYTAERLNELNIAEVTNSAHRTLRIMDKNVFKLIYRRINPITNTEEADEKAAEELADKVSYLNQLLIRSPNLIKPFYLFTGLVPNNGFINKPPMTVMDMLIIFCHITSLHRDLLWQELDKIPSDSAKELKQTLNIFYKKFIKPIKTISKKDLKTSTVHPQFNEVAMLTAKRLIPLTTLVIEDYRVQVDTEETYKKAKDSKNTNFEKLSGKEQVQNINQAAAEENGYYRWELSPFFELAPETEKEFDQLPHYQYRLTQITKLLDAVAEIVQNYRSFLHHTSFQDFLKRCLAKIRNEYALLDNRIARIDSYLGKDESISRGLQAILRPMIEDLDKSLDDFISATSNFERIVSAPDFIDKQKQQLAVKLSAIELQYKNLFKESSGVGDILDTPLNKIESEPNPKDNHFEYTGSSQVVALTKLIQKCYYSLSHASRMGHKGLLFDSLMSRIESQKSLSATQIEKVVLELFRITACYRPRWLSFFQAGYAETQSCTALFEAVKDPRLNAILPVTKIIFGSDLDCTLLKDAEIVQQIKALQSRHRWEESCEDILILNTFQQ